MKRTVFPFGVRIDVSQDNESGQFIASFGEIMDCGSTQEQAVDRLLKDLANLGDHIRRGLEQGKH